MRAKLICLLGCAGVCAFLALQKNQTKSELHLDQAQLPLQEQPLSRIVKVTSKNPGDPSVLMAQIRLALQSDDAGEQSKALNELLPRLVGQNPQLAAEFAQSPELGNWRWEALRVVAQTWALVQPTQTEKWAKLLQNPKERESVLCLVWTQIGQKDPQKAMALLEKQSASSAGPITVTRENLAQQWAERDFKSALNWASSQQGGAQRDRLFARIAMAECKRSPFNAAEVVVDQISPGALQDEAALSILHQWAWKDLAGASAWVEQFPQGDLRDRSLKELEGIKAHIKAE